MIAFPAREIPAPTGKPRNLSPFWTLMSTFLASVPTMPPLADGAQREVAEGSSAPRERGAVGARGQGRYYKGLSVEKRHRRSKIPRSPEGIPWRRKRAPC